jgi:hypothetical protein
LQAYGHGNGLNWLTKNWKLSYSAQSAGAAIDHSTIVANYAKLLLPFFVVIASYTTKIGDAPIGSVKTPGALMASRPDLR